MFKNLLSKLKLLAIGLISILAGFFAGTNSTSPTDYTLTVIDGDCVATTTPGSAIFYTLMGVAALPSSSVRVEVVIDQLATFKFHPCEAISIKNLIAKARLSNQSADWLFNYEKQTAYNASSRKLISVYISPSAMATDIAFSKPFDEEVTTSAESADVTAPPTASSELTNF